MAPGENPVEFGFLGALRCKITRYRPTPGRPYAAPSAPPHRRSVVKRTDQIVENSRSAAAPEWLITASIVSILIAASAVLMLRCASPELSWDEADYTANTARSWGFLWGNAYDYNRHGHGPMAIYLAKLGQEVLPPGFGSFEVRTRFFTALAGSFAIGFLYWALRTFFATSRSAALAGSGLLLFSVIRLEETNVVGPHHLMLACALGILAFGYYWRNSPTLRAAIGLGALMAFGALSMTYVIPAAVCWVVAVGVAGSGWIAWDRAQFKVSWWIAVMILTATLGVIILWPPGVLRRAIFVDFRTFLHYPPFATLVGNRIEYPSRWAVVYWLSHLDPPILMFSSSMILISAWKAFRSGRLQPKHTYLAIYLGFFLAAALAAHLAGARNLLLLAGMMCASTGALFDEVIGKNPRLARAAAAAILVLAALNLTWHLRNSTYVPYLATSGYRAFLKENAARLREHAKALVIDLPILNLYARESGTAVAWDASQVPWTPSPGAPLPPGVKYVLINSDVYDHMPPDQPMRRIVADHWNIVWSFTGDHVWSLRLYENPRPAAP